MKEQNPTALQELDIPEAEKITEADPMVTEQEMIDAVEALNDDPESSLEYEAETQSKIEDVRKQLEETPEVTSDNGGNDNYVANTTTFSGGGGEPLYSSLVTEELPLDDVDILNQVMGKSLFKAIFNLFRPSKWREFSRKRKENEEYNNAKWGHLNR
jgi:hypothetical protein